MKVTKKMAEAVSARMKELNLSTHEVAANAKGKISNGSVWNIVNQRVKDVKEDTFNQLAKGLKMTAKELLERIEPAEKTASNDGLSRNLQKLSPKNRKIAERQISAIIDALAATEPNFDYIDDK